LPTGLVEVVPRLLVALLLQHVLLRRNLLLKQPLLFGARGILPQNL
jgi:hypothetical protein